jgi:hypothetical protein
MKNVDLVSRLGQMIEQAQDSGEIKTANALSYFQLEVIEERQKAWEKGYNYGYQMGIQESELKKSVLNNR